MKEGDWESKRRMLHGRHDTRLRIILNYPEHPEHAEVLGASWFSAFQYASQRLQNAPGLRITIEMETLR